MWTSLRHEIEAKVLLSSPPSIIIIHLGGNDLISISNLQIKDVMRSELLYLREAFPTTIIIWVDILPRRVWGSDPSAYKILENKRSRINRIGRQLVSSLGNFDLVKPDIDSKTAFFRQDGIHLNEVGLEFYLDYLRDAILKNL
jgi:hypothetical protein